MTRLPLLMLLALASRACLAAEPDLDTACLDCHTVHQDRGDVPLIEGQHRDYLTHQLQRFRARHRDSFPMSAFAGGMDDDTIESFAGALAEQPWSNVPTPVSADVIERGGTAAERRGCDSCHGESFAGEGDIPRLAGQRAGYLARQIEGFGTGERYHPPTGTGGPMRNVAPDEARDLAGFMQSLGRATTYGDVRDGDDR